MNHLAFEVDDTAAVRERLSAAGYQNSTPPNARPIHPLFYFYDPDGNDGEFVQYLSWDRDKRHDYEMPD